MSGDSSHLTSPLKFPHLQSLGFLEMADDEKEGEAPSSRGADWEVVQLTASAYAASLGSEEMDRDEAAEGRDVGGGREPESSGALFMSHHFVFPPSEHENLPIDAYSGIQDEVEIQDASHAEEELVMQNEAQERIVRSRSGEDDRGAELFEEGKDVQEMNFTGEGQTIYAAFEHDDPSEQELDSPSKHTRPKDDKYEGTRFPSEAWWKRHAACFYRHAKEANTFWSVCVAAALMGIVVLGRRWKQEQWHLKQLTWHINDERFNQMMGPIGRFKGILVGGQHRSPPIRGSASAGR